MLNWLFFCCFIALKWKLPFCIFCICIYICICSCICTCIFVFVFVYLYLYLYLYFLYFYLYILCICGWEREIFFRNSAQVEVTILSRPYSRRDNSSFTTTRDSNLAETQTLLCFYMQHHLYHFNTN